MMMGVGIFSSECDATYLQHMYELASEQRLFLIIADSDYIYGMNYQMCHGIIGKDLGVMTPQKTMQAMSRTGRGNLQQMYTIRFRNNELIKQLFFPISSKNKEAEVMNRLLQFTL